MTPPADWEDQLSAFRRLRQDTLQRLESSVSAVPAALGGADLQQLVREVRVHADELHAQAEEFSRASQVACGQRDELQELFDLAPVGYVVLDAGGAVVRSNRWMADLIGFSPEAGYKTPFEELVFREDRDIVYILLRGSGKDGAAKSAEFRLMRADGTTVWVLGNVSAKIDSGEVRHRMTLADITERKRGEHALRELSHSLDSKLAACVSKLEDQYRVLRKMSAELSRAEAQEWRHGLGGALDELAAGVESQHGLKVEVDRPEALTALSDPCCHLVYRAVQELLANVVKHSGAPRAALEVRQEEGELWVSVEDEGAGFDPEQAVSRLSGAGLGLASIRERVEANGGMMRIEASPGRGTRVSFYVPAGEEALAIEGVAKRYGLDGTHEALGGLPATRAPAGEAARKHRVLLVDDHEIVREGLRMMLGHAPDVEIVGEAAHGEEAVQQVRSTRPDVVLMDLAMPGVSGIEATRIIKGSHPGVRVIGLSMYSEREAADKMLEAGAEVYVSKEGSPDEVLAAIRRPSEP
jgi:PAS domain S-box-containing protein